MSAELICFEPGCRTRYPVTEVIYNCPRCGGPIATLKSGGRTSYFCPRCQPEP